MRLSSGVSRSSSTPMPIDDASRNWYGGMPLPASRPSSAPAEKLAMPLAMNQTPLSRAAVRRGARDQRQAHRRQHQLADRVQRVDPEQPLGADRAELVGAVLRDEHHDE